MVPNCWGQCEVRQSWGHHQLHELQTSLSIFAPNQGKPELRTLKGFQLCGREVGYWFSCRCAQTHTHSHTQPCWDLALRQTGWFYCRSTTKPLWGFSSVAWQTEGGDLTHRGTPGRRCQADRSERRREKTPLIPQMESLRATLVTLLVTLQSQHGTRKDGGGEESKSWTVDV